MLVKYEDIREMLKSYFDKLLNEKHLENLEGDEYDSVDRTRKYRFYQRLKELDVKVARHCWHINFNQFYDKISNLLG